VVSTTVFGMQSVVVGRDSALRIARRDSGTFEAMAAISMSEWAKTYVFVTMSSVSSVRNETCFVDGNIGCGLRLRFRGRGPLSRIEVVVKGRW